MKGQLATAYYHSCLAAVFGKSFSESHSFWLVLYDLTAHHERVLAEEVATGFKGLLQIWSGVGNSDCDVAADYGAESGL